MTTKSSPALLIASIEPYSGKSGTIVGLAHLLKQRNIVFNYGKPIGTSINDEQGRSEEEDIKFMSQVLGLPESAIQLPLVYLEPDTIEKRLRGIDTGDYTGQLPQYLQGRGEKLLLLEGAGTLWEGNSFDLSVTQISNQFHIPVLLVTRYTSPLIVDSLIKAKQDLGNNLIGVVINDVPVGELEDVQALMTPYLARQGIEVLGMLPSSKLLRSVSVREIVHQLGATVLCRPDRLDWLVESLAIGAMNVNAALEYFRKGENMAVVTGGDRSDLQLAALETSTSCLILTGNIPPDPRILSRAEDLEVPMLSVNLDTLTTVEIVDRAFGTVRFQEQIKVECIQQMMTEHFAIDRLIEKLTIT
ncbi:MAG: ATP-dependent dethiobiotin synthetase BioD [Chroococcopsis gigantea SAG 12.99]|jgi:BioD-like phosphotransacetylase family protein|nr:phosphotransacetylase family protein [Chlorogloea purpurea SAG 13.99]MDV2999115.1 ATP-dependent dethiobiotin synthetase BioD [Chroococcopsis gigantea SAG 12.99]